MNLADGGLNMAAQHARFWKQFRLLAKEQNAELFNHKPGRDWERYRHVGERRPGIGDYVYHLRANDWDVSLEIYIGKGREAENKQIFELLVADRSAIEQRFMGPLEWDIDLLWIKYVIRGVGYHDVERWEDIQREMLDEMRRLTKALDPALKSLGNFSTG
jgi:hypothetical protein